VAKCCGGNLLELGRLALLQDGGKRGVVSPENYAGVGAAMQVVSFSCQYRNKRLRALRVKAMGQTLAGGRLKA
jgi:hypothetical protein